MRTKIEIQNEFASREELEGLRRLHFMGIGGAGMSALVPLARRAGYIVSGSDSSSSPTVAHLQDDGVAVEVGDATALPTDVEALILSDAIDLSSSSEVSTARERGLPLFRRSQLLGHLLKGKKVAAITGTHGKTTTSAMLATALSAAGLDPLAIIGAEIPQFGGAVLPGVGEWAVVEACEAYDALRDIDPDVVILTNLELDHIDFHGNLENLQTTVREFVDRIPVDGLLLYCGEDEGAAKLAATSQVASVAYRELDIPMAAPGKHNRLNAGGAMAAFEFIDPQGDRKVAEDAVTAFTGAERRLQVIQESGPTVIDDYAHHPTEIHASIEALRQRYPGRRLVLVFQPHLYSRTQDLLPEFVEALNEADQVVLTDIYPAREAPIPGVSSSVIGERLTIPILYVPSRHLLPIKVRELVREDDVVIGMGAGTISSFVHQFIGELKKNPIAGRGDRPLSVTVFYAGDSSEREVSLHSGREIFKACQRLGYDVKLVDPTELILKEGDLKSLIGTNRPDVVFLALHGTHAEDGAIQGLLELLHIPYTGSGIQASALAMDKGMTKQILGQNGIKVPNGVILTNPVERPPVSIPLVVKPNEGGSTVGMSFVQSVEEWPLAIAKAFSFGKSVVVEEMASGIEVSVPVLDDRVLPPVEIAPASGVYDFQSKYTPGATNEIIPARLDPEILKRCEAIALEAHRILRCASATRTDMIVSGEEIFVLEVNTLPGMTSTSLLPNSAAAAGIEFDQLCRMLVEDALRRHATAT